MAFTVADALKLAALSDCELIAGAAGLDRKISCIDTMEVPDIYSWLKKNELLITTGYTLKKNEPAGLVKLIEGLYETGAAGIMLKTRFIGDLSEAFLKRAEELSIPVIHIPDNKPFIELTNALMKVIVNEQNKLLDYSEKVRRQFFEMEIREGGLQNIGTTLYEFLAKPVMILDNYDKMAFSFPDMGYFLLESGRHAYGNLVEELFEHAAYIQESLFERCKDRLLYIKPVTVHRKTCGYILVELRSRSELSERDHITLDHADAIMALEFSSRETTYHKQGIMNTNLLLDLIMDNVKTESEAKLRAAYLHWQKLPCLLVVFNIEEFSAFARTKDEKENLFVKQQIFFIIRERITARHVSCSIINESDRFVLIVPKGCESILKELVADIQTAIEAKFHLSLTAGVSGIVEQYIEIKRAYHDANDALKIGRNTGERLVFITDYSFEQAVLNGADAQYLKLFVENSIGRLRSYDAENGTELLYTLKVLISHMGIKTRAAKALYLHRNTLLYRVRRIESILNCDLENPEKLMELGIAIRLSKLIEK